MGAIWLLLTSEEDYLRDFDADPEIFERQDCTLEYRHYGIFLKPCNPCLLALDWKQLWLYPLNILWVSQESGRTLCNTIIFVLRLGHFPATGCTARYLRGLNYNLHTSIPDINEFLYEFSGARRCIHTMRGHP